MALNEQIGYRGAADATSAGSPYNESLFLIQQVLSEVSTAKLVLVKAVTNSGGVSAVGFVDVLPLVNQLDGEGNSVPHGVVHNIPYFRLQGGANAIILDPQVGDIGICVFADRDISTVKATKAVANPGSRRRFDMADGLYIGGFLNGTPMQYVQFSGAGIALVSPTKILLRAPEVEIDSPQTTITGATLIQGMLTWTAGMTGSIASGVATTITGTIRFIGELFANDKRIDDTHTHNGVQPGSGNSGDVN